MRTTTPLVSMLVRTLAGSAPCWLCAWSALTALPAQAPPLIAHWRFDEVSGTSAADSGPLGNAGTLVNFPGTQWVAGQLGGALQFDGVNDYVSIAVAGGLPIYDGLGTPFSIAFWVKAPAQSDRRVYSEQQSAPPNAGPLFTLGSSSGTGIDKLRVFVRNDIPANVVVGESNGVVFDDTWHHVLYSDHAGRAKIYLDGVLDTVLDYSRYSYAALSPLRSTFGLNSVTLGAVVRNQAIATPLAGLVDDLRIYRAALDDQDAQLLILDVHPATIVGSLAAFGYGCGPGPLDLAVTGSAALGGTIHVQLFRGSPGSLALVGAGLGGLAPLDLGGFGFPGCTLYQQNVTTFVVGVLGVAGSSPPFSLAVPAAPGLTGAALSLQGLALNTTVETAPAAIAQIGR